jgi:hypothetical protein
MDAPVCRQCGKKLQPSTRHVERRIESVNALGQLGFITRDDVVVIPGRYDLDDLFCTRRCGYSYGVACARRDTTVAPR